MSDAILSSGTSQRTGYSPKCWSEEGTKKTDHNVTMINNARYT